VAVSSQEVVKRDTIKIYDIQRPESILDLDCVMQQISLLSKVQNALLAEQTILIDPELMSAQIVEKLKKNGQKSRISMRSLATINCPCKASL